MILDGTIVALRDPRTLPASFVTLELAVLACGALTLSHALRERRRGDGTALFTWLTIFVYGLTMELASYRFVDNFWHGQFTVMLYRRQLPLYIVTIYPTLLYAGIATARRLRLARWAEPVAAGLLIVAADFPFDTVGPVAGWWRWSSTDPVVAWRWLGVPVTSYYWHLAFGAILSALTRSLGKRTLALAPLAALATIVLGVVSFLPFHGLKALGVGDGVIVAGLLTLAVTIALYALTRAPAVDGADVLLLAVTVVFGGEVLACSVVMLAPVARAAVAVVAIAALGVHALAHRALRPSPRLA